MNAARVLPYGDRALLIELDDRAAVVPLAEALRAEDGVQETVPAAQTVLVRANPAALAALRARVPQLLAGLAAQPEPEAELITLDVYFDGPDLSDLGARTGLGADEVVRRHCAPTYVVAFCGFAPGFAYLTGLDEALQVPRLEQPRTDVAAGAVGVAGEFTGVYPRSSPGGWRLLGHTDAQLWDAGREPPALLVPGTRVRFRAA